MDAIVVADLDALPAAAAEEEAAGVLAEDAGEDEAAEEPVEAPPDLREVVGLGLN